MKQYINSFMLALSITYNLKASLPVQYWNDNVHKPKSTIHKHISLTDKCKQTIAMIKERKTVNLDKLIPLLMEFFTKEIQSNPEIALDAKSQNGLYPYIKNYQSPITSGPIFEIFKILIDKEPFLQGRKLTLHNDIDIDNSSHAMTVSSLILLQPTY